MSIICVIAIILSGPLGHIMFKVMHDMMYLANLKKLNVFEVANILLVQRCLIKI